MEFDSPFSQQLQGARKQPDLSNSFLPSNHISIFIFASFLSIPHFERSLPSAMPVQMASSTTGGLNLFYDLFRFGMIRSAFFFVIDYAYTPATILLFLLFSIWYWKNAMRSLFSHWVNVLDRPGIYFFFIVALPDLTTWTSSFVLETVLKEFIEFLGHRRLRMQWFETLVVQCGLVTLSYCWYLFKKVRFS